MYDSFLNYVQLIYHHSNHTKSLLRIKQRKNTFEIAVIFLFALIHLVSQAILALISTLLSCIWLTNFEA